MTRIIASGEAVTSVADLQALLANMVGSRDPGTVYLVDTVRVELMECQLTDGSLVYDLVVKGS